MWRRDQLTDDDKSKYPDRQWAETIEVPPCIARFLRPHQREGVQFMAECVLGLRRFKGNGAILADDMGLGNMTKHTALAIRTELPHFAFVTHSHHITLYPLSYRPHRQDIAEHLTALHASHPGLRAGQTYRTPRVHHHPHIAGRQLEERAEEMAGRQSECSRHQ